MTRWQDAQNWELGWHDNCVNSFHEEEKQLIYAEKMGLICTPTPKTPYNFDLKGKTVLDIGAGPYSLLLKCTNFKIAYAIDPLMLNFPMWVKDRYDAAGIDWEATKGEDVGFDNFIYDEVWIYNVLEHVENPKKIIENAQEAAKLIRIFEWLDTPPNVGHPQTLREDELNEWLRGEGKIESIKRGGATGKAYYGIFKGNHY